MMLFCWALILGVCSTAAAQSAPMAVAEALRFSVEEPKAFLRDSSAWLDSDFAQNHPEWLRDILLRRGRAAWMIADRTQAREASAALQQLAEARHMPTAQAYALFLKADELADFGHYQAAATTVSEAADILRGIDDPYWRGIADAELCDAYWTSDQEVLAKRYCNRALLYFQIADDPWTLARIENLVSTLLSNDDENEQAIAIAQQAQERFRQLQMPSMVAMVDDNLSSIYLASGDAAKALAVSERSLGIELAASKFTHAVSSRINIAYALSKLGRHKEALASIDAAIADAERVGLDSFKDAIYLAQMEVAKAAGKLPLALEAAALSMEASTELASEQTNRAITEMEARYAAAEQARQIERLAQEQRIRELELQSSRHENLRQSAQLAEQNLWLWLVTVVTLALLAVSVLLLALWRSSRRHAQRMRWLADTDGLTGVFNRRAFVERARECFANSVAAGAPAAICIIDADHFKRINDTRGHQVGDQALIRISTILSSRMGQGAVFGRLGGEEFGLLLAGTDLPSALEQVEQLRQAIDQDHQQADGLGFPLTVSIGLAMMDANHMADSEAWQVAADQALYRAKALGRNRVEVAPIPTSTSATESPSTASAAILPV
jgi:diguanylate cyclase (GGDEF)-like protein